MVSLWFLSAGSKDSQPNSRPASKNENNNAVGSRPSTRGEETREKPEETEEAQKEEQNLLEYPAEVLFLAKRVQGDEMIAQALNDYDEGNKDAIEVCCVIISISY